jgi:hypothetical protein
VRQKLLETSLIIHPLKTLVIIEPQEIVVFIEPHPTQMSRFPASAVRQLATSIFKPSLGLAQISGVYIFLKKEAPLALTIDIFYNVYN